MRRSNLQTGLILLALVAFGLSFFYLGFEQFSLVQRRQNWPTERATIDSAEIIQAEDSAPEIKVSFNYQVQGQTYRTIDYWDQFDQPGRIPEHLHVGQQLTVYYAPDDPSSAVLHPGTYSQAIFLFVLGSIPLLIASPFIAYWAVMRFVRYKMSVAKYHLNEAMKLMDEGREAMESMKQEQGFISEDLTEKERQTATRAEEVKTLIEGLEAEISAKDEELESSASPANADGTKKTIPESSQPFRPIPVKRSITPSASGPKFPEPFEATKLWQTLLAVCIPIAIGWGISWLAPYYTFTCVRTNEGIVNCRIEQVIYGLIPSGEPQRVNNLREIEGLRKGTGRTKYGYLRLVGQQTWEERTSRETLSTKLLIKFLRSDASGPMRLSDGRAMTGLWLPWMVGLFGIVAGVITFSDWNFISRPRKDQSARVPTASRLVAFAMGAYLMLGITGFVFVLFVDIYQAGMVAWFSLCVLVALGGVINIGRLRWRNENATSSSLTGTKSVN